MTHDDLRNGSVDFARLVSSAGIVWFHAHAPGQTVSYSALAVFLVFLIVLPINARHPITSHAFILGRADRLLRPWLIWSAIYAVLKAGQAWSSGSPISNEFDASMLLMGTQQNLWFLPFGFVCSIVAFFALRSVDRRRPTIFVLTLLSSGISIPISGI